MNHSPRPYWLTKEWWTQGDPPNSELGNSELARGYPEVGESAWKNRRRRAMQMCAKEGWGIDFLPLHRGYHDQRAAATMTAAPERMEQSADGEPILAPERVAPVIVDPSMLTTEEKVERDREVMRLRQRVDEAERKYAEAIRGGEVEDRIISRVAAMLPALEPCGSPTFTPRNPGTPETVVALVSDYHIGEVVSAEETGGVNAYDMDIFRERWQYHVDSIGGICLGKLTGYDFPVLHIVGLGDMISGLIHDELVETSDSTLMDWLIEGSWVLAQGIRQLAAEFPEVRVDWLFGNHGRVTQKVRYKRRWVNYDYLLGHMVATELRDVGNVTFTNHKSFFALINVADHNLLALHGDQIKAWAGIPWYGITRATTNLSALLKSQRKTFDLVALGHFHNAGLLDRVDCELVLNGSGIGGNEFSIGALFTSTAPRQVIFGVHPERGRTWQYAIDLSHGDGKGHRFA